MATIEQTPDVWVGAHVGGRDHPAACFACGQGFLGGDWAAFLYRGDEGEFVILRSPAIPEGEVWYPLEPIRAALYGAERRAVPVQSVHGYCDLNQGGRLILKLDIDGGDHERHHRAAITTRFVL